jgi:hypothetical protein
MWISMGKREELRMSDLQGTQKATGDVKLGVGDPGKDTSKVLERLDQRFDAHEKETAGMYAANIERFGVMFKYTALLTGVTLALTGFANVVQFHPIPARDAVLIIGGLAVMAFPYVLWSLGKK